jgi:hypothetical protein
MEISFSRARDHKWKIPAQNGPILREQIRVGRALFETTKEAKTETGFT